MNPDIDWFFAKTSKWQEAYEMLRRLLLSSGLKEELKWGCPCYTLGKSNIVLIHGFKGYCALLFMKGVLLKDESKILVQQTPNVQAARQIRFTSAEQIGRMEPVLQAYVQEAVAVERAGLKVEMKRVQEFSIPQEFQTVLDEMPELQTAFQRLTPGRQRAYLLYFSAPKGAKTRESRIEKYVDHILHGKGLED